MFVTFTSNTEFAGKPKAVESSTGRINFYFEGKYVNLATNWKVFSVPLKSAFKWFSVYGKSNSAVLSSDRRSDANFVSRQILMIDIDSGMRIDQLLSDTFYKEHAVGYYTTPSHTEENHRFRIVFAVDTPITDKDTYKQLVIQLMKKFECADPACKDASRIFYGSINSQNEYLGNVLPQSEVDALLTQYHKENNKQRLQLAAKQARTYDALTETEMNEIIEFLSNHPWIDYQIWLKLAWALKASGFTLYDFQVMSRSLKESKSPTECERIWNNGDVSRSNTGSLINCLKDLNYPKYTTKAKKSTDARLERMKNRQKRATIQA
jgi:hypothetical protein